MQRASNKHDGLNKVKKSTVQIPRPYCKINGTQQDTGLVK